MRVAVLSLLLGASMSDPTDLGDLGSVNAVWPRAAAAGPTDPPKDDTPEAPFTHYVTLVYVAMPGREGAKIDRIPAFKKAGTWCLQSGLVTNGRPKNGDKLIFADKTEFIIDHSGAAGGPGTSVPGVIQCFTKPAKPKP